MIIKAGGDFPAFFMARTTGQETPLENRHSPAGRSGLILIAVQFDFGALRDQHHAFTCRRSPMNRKIVAIVAGLLAVIVGALVVFGAL
jgi:hypothetical protein